MENPSPWTLRRIETIHQVSQPEWNGCVGPDDPFLTHEFFECLEDSGTACPQTGWQPCHLLLSQGSKLVALAPLFVKVHSEGEFIFDYAWAAAYERAGGAYYPKLHSSVPYIPVTGPRYLVSADCPDPELARKLLRQGQLALARSLRVSSLHVTHCNESDFESAPLEDGWMPRLSLQFHFENPGYRDFSDFLSRLSARKRKAILKERAKVAESGLHLETLTGDQLRPGHADALYRCYRETSSRKWGRVALTPEFFHMLLEKMADRVVLMLASRLSPHDLGGATRPRYAPRLRPPVGPPAVVAAAFNVRGANTLYGRNWGCLEEVEFLHFELCYYRAIEFAIEHGLKRVEAGAQGFHKMARGYLPRFTYSLHSIANPGFAEVIDDFLVRERAEVSQERELLERECSPYKSGPTALGL